VEVGAVASEAAACAGCVMAAAGGIIEATRPTEVVVAITCSGIILAAVVATATVIIAAAVVVAAAAVVTAAVNVGVNVDVGDVDIVVCAEIGICVRVNVGVGASTGKGIGVGGASGGGSAALAACVVLLSSLVANAFEWRLVCCAWLLLDGCDIAPATITETSSPMGAARTTVTLSSPHLNPRQRRLISRREAQRSGRHSYNRCFWREKQK